jgi:hypothetical protein
VYITIGPSEDQSGEPEGCRYPTVTIELPGEGWPVAAVVERLVRPALLSFGYIEGSVNRVLGEPD